MLAIKTELCNPFCTIVSILYAVATCHLRRLFLFLNMHRTKYQESVNGNVAEICETVAETRRLTRVSAVGLVTFTRGSVAAITVDGNKFFRQRKHMVGF